MNHTISRDYKCMLVLARSTIPKLSERMKERKSATINIVCARCLNANMRNTKLYNEQQQQQQQWQSNNSSEMKRTQV